MASNVLEDEVHLLIASWQKLLGVNWLDFHFLLEGVPLGTAINLIVEPLVISFVSQVTQVIFF